MKRCFVDADLFIRYLTNDIPEKAEMVERLLRDAGAGKVRLFTAEMVIAEIVWVLESAYGLASSQIAAFIRAILATPGLEVLNARLVSIAIEHYESKNIDFIDGYIAAVMDRHNVTDIYSYDKKHLSRIKTIHRKEP